MRSPAEPAPKSSVPRIRPSPCAPRLGYGAPPAQPHRCRRNTSRKPDPDAPSLRRGPRRARRARPRRSRSTTGAITRRTRRRSRTPNTTRCAGATRRSRRAFPSSRRRDSLTEKVGAKAVGEIRQGAPPRADAVARQRLRATRTCASSSSASAASSRSARRRRSPSPPSRRSTACRCACATRTASSCTAATRGDGADGEDVTANVAHDRRHPAEAARQGRPGRLSRCAARSIMSHADFAALNERQAAAGEHDLRQSAQRRRRLAAPARPAITASRPLRFFAYAWGEMSALPARDAVRHDAGVRATGASRPIR